MPVAPRNQPAAPRPPAPASATPVAVDPAAVALSTPGTEVSTDNGSVVTMPTVEAPPLPKIDGVDPVASPDAEFEVAHHLIVGKKVTFRQGDKINEEDLPEGVDVERLVKLGALKSLKDDAPADDAPAK